MFVLIGLGILAVFGFLYFQEWWKNRRLRQLTEMARLRQARTQAPTTPAPARLPLIRIRAPRQASASPRPNGSEAPAPEEPPTPSPEESQAQSAAPSANARRGRLEICADEAGCEVFVNDAFIGNAPARVTVPEGMHLVRVKSPAGAEYRREIFVSEAADLRLQAVLESNSEANTRKG